MPIFRITALAAALLAGTAIATIPVVSQAQIAIGISIRVAPPPLPVYAQPPLPGPGYIWTPGYWAWANEANDYYWVPGTWVNAPQPGYLWTPNYWGWNNGVYEFHAGYWGPHIGYYGGVNYGFGYTGNGYEGGYWRGNNYFYNRSVNNVGNVHITNVYNKTVIVNRTTNVSYNGGPGGLSARPTSAQLAAARDNHIAMTSMQTQHVQAARADKASFAAANHGAPPVGATQRPGALSGAGVVAARRAPGAPAYVAGNAGAHGAGPNKPGAVAAGQAGSPGRTPPGQMTTTHVKAGPGGEHATGALASNGPNAGAHAGVHERSAAHLNANNGPRGGAAGAGQARVGGARVGEARVGEAGAGGGAAGRGQQFHPQGAGHPNAVRAGEGAGGPPRGPGGGPAHPQGPAHPAGPAHPEGGRAGDEKHPD